MGSVVQGQSIYQTMKFSAGFMLFVTSWMFLSFAPRSWAKDEPVVAQFTDILRQLQSLTSEFEKINLNYGAYKKEMEGGNIYKNVGDEDYGDEDEEEEEEEGGSDYED